MIRQAFRSSAVWFFANRDLQTLRIGISRFLQIFWPTYQRSTLATQVLFDQAAGADEQGGDGWRWRRIDAELDINPGSGEAFLNGRRPATIVRTTSDVIAPGPVDLTCHFFPRRTKREPSLVLYSGADTSMAAFVGGLLPRFFALEEMGVPKDVLLFMGLELAQQRYFQDAIIDQVFHPRPIDLMRRHRLLRVNTLHEIDAPLLSPRLLARMAERFAAIYGPFEAKGAPVFLCSGGAGRAADLAKAYRRKLPGFFDRDHLVLDPARHSLRRVVKAVASASLVVAPNTGEAAVLALAPWATRSFHELSVAASPHVLADRLVIAIGEKRAVLS